MRWGPGNVFFGGVSAVLVRDDGELEAAGDPRRGGAGVVVRAWTSVRRGRATQARWWRWPRRSEAEPEGWLVTDGEWRSVGDERRYLRAIRRSKHATVLVAEQDGEVAGRLSITRDPHPASRHVADLGLMVSQGHRRRGVGRVAHAGRRGVGARRGRGRRSSCTSSRTTRRRSALYEELGYRREGLRIKHYRRGDDLHDVILMAKEIA